MALKINVGLSKKLGLPDYGSSGCELQRRIRGRAGAVSRPISKDSISGSAVR